MSDRSAVVEELVLDYGWELIAAPPGGPVLMRYIGAASQVAAQVSSEGSMTLMVSRSGSAVEGEWMIEFGPEVPDSLVVRCVAEATEYA